MRTETTTRTLYTFEELSPEAQQKAIDNCRYWNVEPGTYWWDSTYEDAGMAWLKLESFDLDRRRHATGQFVTDAEDCAKAIIENHGPDCETFKTATAFLGEFLPVLAKQTMEEEKDDYDYDLLRACEYEIGDMTADFLKSLLKDYSIILQCESEYLKSDEAVKESLILNECEFLESGERA